MVPMCLLLRFALQGPIWPSGGGYESGVGITAPATENASLQILFKCPTPAIVFRNATKTLTSCSLLTRCTIPCACHAKRDLNVQKWSVHGVLCTFWLRNVLRATMACTFSTSQLSIVLRKWGVFSFFTCKCASRHNGVHFFISHLARWLRTRCFSEPTFRPSGATNHWKNAVFRDFLTFSRTCIFFLLTLSLLWSSLSISAFYLSILSEVWLLNFLRQIDYFKSLFPQGLYFDPTKTTQRSTILSASKIFFRYAVMKGEPGFDTEIMALTPG